MTKKKKLPPGISQRGDSFRVSIMVDGVRRTGTRPSLEEAVELAEDIRKGLLDEPGEGREAPWKLSDAIERYADEHLLPGGYSVGREDDPAFTPHICRHTFCTRLVAGGVDLKTVQTLAGHKDISTTMNYSHYIPNKAREALMALEARPAPEDPLKGTL